MSDAYSARILATLDRRKVAGLVRRKNKFGPPACLAEAYGKYWRVDANHSFKSVRYPLSSILKLAMKYAPAASEEQWKDVLESIGLRPETVIRMLNEESAPIDTNSGADLQFQKFRSWLA